MIQTFLVNTDLKMRKGKIAAQVAHGETLYMEDKFNKHSYGGMYDRYIKWKSGGMYKVVLKSTEREMIEIMTVLDNFNTNYYVVRDFGLTQVPKNSFTVLAVEPLGKSSHEDLFSEFKLW